MENRIRSGMDPAMDFAVKKIMESDLTNLRYLYQFGEYVTSQEEDTATFLNSLPEEEIQIHGKYVYGRISEGVPCHGKGY